MLRAIVRPFLTLAAAASLAACAQALPDSRTPFPVPSNMTALQLHTTPPADQPIPENWACPGALLAPVTVVRDGDAVVFERDGQRVDLVWPRGFSARSFNGGAQIVAPDGSVVALEGETLKDYLGGDASAICSVADIIYPPAS